MDAWPPALKVILGAVAFAVGTILFLFVGALLMARHLQWKMGDLPLIHKQVPELSRQRQGGALRWLRRRMLLGFLTIALLFLAVFSKQWYLFWAILIMLPLSFVLYGLEVMDLKYVVVNLPFRPTRLLTGDAAVRHGRLLLIAGVVLSVLWVGLAVLGGLVTFFLSASPAE